MNPPGSVLKDDGSPYTIFTPFYKKAKLIPISKPVSNDFHNYYVEEIQSEVDKSIFDKILPNKNNQILLKGGYREALQLLEQIKNLSNYETVRNIPSIKGTTFLSAHNKLGTVSIRKVYWTIVNYLGQDSQLISELYWRDFFTHIVFHFPYVMGSAFQKKYNTLSWKNDESQFRLWCQGKTGFPIVDAGMRELNTTGYMHNRVRMIVASFLVKDLHIDWRWGEKYFAQKLIDYDPAVNNGSWQWSASVGCDAQPLRIFNPWLRQEKFDPDCLYIKKWVPELKNIPSSIIHNLYKNFPGDLNYPSPIVDHYKESLIAKEIYKKI